MTFLKSYTRFEPLAEQDADSVSDLGNAMQGREVDKCWQGLCELARKNSQTEPESNGNTLNSDFDVGSAFRGLFSDVAIDACSFVGVGSPK